MREKLYNYLVNRHPVIRENYHRYHDQASGGRILLSWIYLFWMNLCIHIPGCRIRGARMAEGIFEEKKLSVEKSESALAAEGHSGLAETVEELSKYDVVSFDIFDTLLFRPFSSPADLFFFIGEELEFPDFKHIRQSMEQEAREACRRKNGHTEISLRDIWEKIEQETGIPAQKGMELELGAERKFCYANPFMLEVFHKLKGTGAQLIAVSDMYLPEAYLWKLLEDCGYQGLKRVFVSCEYQTNKASGGLYELVKEKLPKGCRAVHVGDNPVSDGKLAKEHGFATYGYPNTDQLFSVYRPLDMSPMVGSAYRGIVNHFLGNGTGIRDMEYEYGFIYGGLFVLGYCNFIHRYGRTNGMDKILFLSRDGDILKQVYDRLYPGEQTEYVYWSRAAATKLMAEYNKYDYFLRFLTHKVNQGRRIGGVFEAMDLAELLDGLPEDLNASMELTSGNAERVKRYLNENWKAVLSVYEEQQQAAGEYYGKVLEGCKKACAVDIGWAGSGALSLAYLVKRRWKMDCEITGLIAGTNTAHNAEPETSETFLQAGKLVSYLYSASHNRDLWKKHDLNRGYNLYWELLLASPTRQFLGFAKNPDSGETELRFGGMEKNPEGIRSIQRGILDFVEEYSRHFKEHPEMFVISGRDAYAPMLAASGYEEKYLKKIYGKFDLSVQVGE